MGINFFHVFICQPVFVNGFQDFTGALCAGAHIILPPIRPVMTPLRSLRKKRVQAQGELDDLEDDSYEHYSLRMGNLNAMLTTTTEV